MRSMIVASDLLRDVRFAFRALRKSPITSAVSILALALGIGVNAGSFVATNALILHPFPFPRLDRIVTISERLSKVGSGPSALPLANFAALKTETKSFEQLAAYRRGNLNLTSSIYPERVRSYLVSPSFFSILGTKAKLGRTFFASEDRQSRSNVVVVSYAFWKSHLAGSREALGKPISLGSQSYTVIGIMPDQFDFPLGTQIWTPLALSQSQLNEHTIHDASVLGLLKPGVAISQAAGEAEAVAARLAIAYPAFNQDHRFVVAPINSMSDRITARFVLTVLGSAIFVLLLACANIGNLQLARAANRQKEIAVRAALGATQFQVARQLFTETVLLAAAAAPVGLLLASWNNDRAKAAIPAQALRVVSGLRTMHIDGAVIFFTCIISLAAAVLCSLPAIAQLAHRRMRMDLTDVLRDRSGSRSAIGVRNGLRGALIVFEVALALVLLVGAALMGKTFNRLLHLNQGFDPKNILTMQTMLPESNSTGPARVSFYDRALANFAALGDVQSSGLFSALGAADHFAIEGQAEPRAGEPHPQISAVSSGYLRTLRVPQLQGRFISGADRPDSPRVVVLSESVVRHYWPNSSPIGHKVRFETQPEWLTVVGVCGDIIDDWFSGQPTPAAYVSYAQFPSASVTFALRTTGDPMRVAGEARAAIRQLDKSLAVYELGSLEQFQSDQRSGVRAAADTMASYSFIALLLAVTGIYAVISYFVASRTHDIGVHMALGASRASVLKMTLGQATRLIVLGLALGIPIAYACSRFVSSILSGVVNIDFGTFAVYAGVLAASALLASYLPARRATKIDPLTALRVE